MGNINLKPGMTSAEILEAFLGPEGHGDHGTTTRPKTTDAETERDLADTELLIKGFANDLRAMVREQHTNKPKVLEFLRAAAKQRGEIEFDAKKAWRDYFGYTILALAAANTVLAAESRKVDWQPFATMLEVAAIKALLDS